MVFVEGSSLAHAVRRAVHYLGVGVGQTRSKTETAPGEWRWDWSGTILQVRVVPRTEPFGEFLKPLPPLCIPPTAIDKRIMGGLSARLAKPLPIIDLRFDRRVAVQLSHDACAELARGAAEGGGRDAYVQALLLEAAARRPKTGAVG